MIAYIWPIALVIISNIVYQICAKGVPESMNPFAALTVTYIVGAAISIIMYFALNRGGNIFKELAKVNFAPITLGFIIVGLEVGYIYAYKAGWQVSTASTVQSSVLAIALIFVGFFMYKEKITWNKSVGLIACLVGIIFMNMKS